MKPKVAEALYRRHEEYWARQKRELRKYRSAYMTQYWDNDYDNNDDQNASYLGINLSELNDSGFEVDSPFEYIQVVEYYDLVNNKMLVWSP